MLAKESLGPNFDLPEEIAEVLPSDPFEQLDVARKITSIALSTRVFALESEASFLSAKVTEKDAIIAELQAQLDSLDSSLAETADKLSLAHRDKEKLLNENESLANEVKKLNRDVAKLESFRKTLMRSLQDDDGNAGGAAQVAVAHTATDDSLSSQSVAAEDTATFPPSRASSIQSQVSEVENSNTSSIQSQVSDVDHETDASRPRISPGLLLASQTSTPRLTPPGSPPSLASPKRTSRPLSPRRHSISFATTRGMFDDRASFSSMPPSYHSSVGHDAGRARVDGKEFFRQVRSRLSYEQFGSFLANVKELNSHKQTREETLRKADEIFGPENNDLYAVFEGLITRKA